MWFIDFIPQPSTSLAFITCIEVISNIFIRKYLKRKSITWQIFSSLFCFDKHSAIYSNQPFFRYGWPLQCKMNHNNSNLVWSISSVMNKTPDIHLWGKKLNTQLRESPSTTSCVFFLLYFIFFPHVYHCCLKFKIHRGMLNN